MDYNISGVPETVQRGSPVVPTVSFEVHKNYKGTLYQSLSGLDYLEQFKSNLRLLLAERPSAGGVLISKLWKMRQSYKLRTWI